MKCILSIFEVRKGQRIIELAKDSIFVGRDPNKSDIELDPLDLSASRTHFVIEKKIDYYFLKDFSKTGTWVNGERVGNSGRRLYHGDVIEAGNAEITIFLTDDIKSAEQLLEEGREKELLDPSYSVQCYALAYQKSPANIEYLARLINLLEKEGKNEELITGGSYFNPEDIMRLAADARITVPIARAFVKAGEFSKAIEIIEQAGGESADNRFHEILKDIRRQTGEKVLKTIVTNTSNTPFCIQRGNLKIYIDERADFTDLRFIERYYKYLEQRIDPLFGGHPKKNVVFHVTSYDRLFAQSLPQQGIILGYYSCESERIFIRPRRWMEDKTAENDFHIVLLHEYVHFRIDEMLGGIWIPRWYNEGLAQVFSDTKRPEDFMFLKSIRDKCKHIWAFSDATFLPIYGDPSIAYLQSYAILLYLLDKFGNEKLVSVITTISESGGDFQNLFEEILGISFQELDNKWWSILEED